MGTKVDNSPLCLWLGHMLKHLDTDDQIVALPKGFGH